MPSILLAEDERPLREALREMLSDEGYEIEVAVNGWDALDKQTIAPADLILSNIMMPELTGIEFVRALRNRGDSTPVIFVSSQWAAVHDLANTYVLDKPFDIDQVLAMVHQVIEQSTGEHPASTA